MSIVPFGAWIPDNPKIESGRLVVARNVIPVETGYDPLPSLEPATAALDSQVFGSGLAINQAGAGVTFAGEADKLSKLEADTTWLDVSRLVGGPYGTVAGERWRFADFAGLAIATNGIDDPQKFDIEAGVNFEALGGTPPVARYITIIKDHVVLGNLLTQPSTDRSNEVEWSGNGDAEQWGGVAGNAGSKILFEGGPVQGLIGGEVGYVFQRNSIQRMTFVSETRFAFQFDEVGRGQGTTAPNSIVNRGAVAYYLGRDGFYKLDIATGVSQPISAEKTSRFFFDSQRTGTNFDVLGAVAIFRPIIIWAYVSNNTVGETPDKVILYNWQTGEWSEGEVAVVDMLSFISPGYTLDNIDSFGTLDTLPFTLDSPFWSAGSEVLGIFGTDNKLGHLTGTPLPATFRTAQFQPNPNGRAYVSGIRPVIDTKLSTAGIGAVEAPGDTMSIGSQVAQEANGSCPQHLEGRYTTVDVQVPSGASWTTAEGFEPEVQPAGDQ